MAYLDTRTLTCPACALRGEVQIIVGVGPASQPQDTPYRHIRQAGPFVAEVDAGGAETGRLLCPEDATPVWSDTPARSPDTNAPSAQTP